MGEIPDWLKTAGVSVATTVVTYLGIKWVEKTFTDYTEKMKVDIEKKLAEKYKLAEG